MGNLSPWRTVLRNLFKKEPQTRSDLLYNIQYAKENNLVNHDTLAMIEGAINVNQLIVKDAMIPHAQMVVVNANQGVEEALPTITSSGHSRFPVINSDQDQVIGILLSKDLLKITPHDNISIKDIAREAMFVPESKHLDKLLKEFKQKRQHIAMVVDEYGGIAGLITLEDVLEEIVGEIEDEFDPEEEAFIQKINENNFSVRAITPLSDFNKYFSCDYQDNEYDTIGGLLLRKFSHIPHKGESIILDRFKITVSAASDKTIEQLKVTLQHNQAK